MIDDLFYDDPAYSQIKLGEGSLLIRQFITPYTTIFIKQIQEIVTRAPFRKMITPTGHKMSVEMTSSGTLGWISDLHGYRYTPVDPLTNNHWPLIPNLFKELAIQAANRAGYYNYNPNICLINRYLTGSKLSLHQDKDEKNLQAPIVSFSLGIPAVFQWGGLQRNDKITKITLLHGDTVGEDRLRFHGILPIKPAVHTVLGKQRINLTFRQFY